MDLRIRLAQKQKLIMTLNMKQMIKLLQLSSVDLCQEVNDMLESCVLLEVDDQDFRGNRVTHVSYGWDYECDVEVCSLPETLHEHLSWQLNLLSLSSFERLVAEVLIDGIDDKGYLTVTPEEVLSTLKAEAVGISSVLPVLHKIQGFDPAGVAARTQQECLSLQLERVDAPFSVKKNAFYLLEKCYSELIHGDLSALKYKTGWCIDDVSMAFNVITCLHPFPGHIIDSARVVYCTPDVFVFKNDDSWSASLNPRVSPILKINSHYVNSINVLPDAKAKEVKFWRNQLRDARFFVRGLNNRYSTILQVMHILVEKQQRFLDQGEEGMQVLSMQSVAAELGLHESTISRVVQNKYVQIPQGVVAMNYFFSSGVSNQNISAVALKSHIRQMITRENQEQPFSDIGIQQQLQRLNISVARRTVTKYRKELGFASSRHRKYKRIKLL